MVARRLFGASLVSQARWFRPRFSPRPFAPPFQYRTVEGLACETRASPHLSNGVPRDLSIRVSLSTDFQIGLKL